MSRQPSTTPVSGILGMLERGFADAHINLAGLCGRLGREADALPTLPGVLEAHRGLSSSRGISSALAAASRRRRQTTSR